MTTNEPTPGRAQPGRPRGWRKGVVKFSKMYLRRVDDTRALTSSIKVFRDQVTEGLGERLAPELAKDETLPDFSLSLDLYGRSVKSALERLREAERLCFERARDARRALRASKRLARREIYPRVVLVRRMIDSQFGREVGRRVHGMAGRTLRKPKRLHAQLHHLVWTLENEEEELPEPLVGSAATEREAWLRQIRPGYLQLTQLLDELVDLELAEQGARDEKRAAEREFDATYAEARYLVEASFVFAGHGGTLVRRLRSYVHRRFLSRDAQRKRQERAEGRVKRTLRSAASSVRGWIGGRPPSVA